MTDDVRAFVEGLDLPDPGPQLESLAAPGTPDLVAARPAVAVGSQLAEFGDEVPADCRAAVADALLLAQLAADKAASAQADPLGWFQVHGDVLRRIGWLQTGFAFETTAVRDEGADLHRAILPALGAMLGPAGMAGAAVPLLVKALDGLQAMDAGRPWITLFDRASTHAHGAKLQLSLVRSDGEMVRVSTCAVAVSASRTLTRVLFVKLAGEGTTLSVAQGQHGATRARLLESAPAVAARVAPHVAANIASIDI